MSIKYSIITLVILIIFAISPVKTQQSRPTTKIAWSADGQYLAVGYEYGVLVYENLVSKWAITISDHAFLDVTFSADGQTLYGVNTKGEVYSWNVENGQVLASWALADVRSNIKPEDTFTHAVFEQQNDAYLIVGLGSQSPDAYALLDKDLNFLGDYIDTLFWFRYLRLLEDNTVLTAHTSPLVTVERDFQPVFQIPYDELWGLDTNISGSQDGHYLFVKVNDTSGTDIIDITTGEIVVNLPSAQYVEKVVNECIVYQDDDSNYVLYAISDEVVVDQFPATYNESYRYFHSKDAYLIYASGTLTLMRLDNCTSQIIKLDTGGVPYLIFNVQANNLLLINAENDQSKVILYDLTSDEATRAESLETIYLPSDIRTEVISNQFYVFSTSQASVFDTVTGELLHQQPLEDIYYVGEITVHPDGTAYAFRSAGKIIVRQFSDEEQEIILPHRNF